MFAPGRDAEAAHQPGAQIRTDVAVEVFAHHDVELRRILDHAHLRGVDDDFFVLDVRVILLVHLARFVEQHAVAHLHDVGLVKYADLPALSVGRRSETSKARCADRRARVATFMLTTTPSVIRFSMPLYRPSVFSRTMTKSTLSKRVFTRQAETVRR